ncbi:Hypothetical protein, conserved [Brucella abortus str. 2308 A]|uniref:Uncharacterized protein n=4 Tax=Brucella TaxID=234 RepID=Q57BC1_BRUAB|nr:hypothetical protein BR1760 [Brucella suis 1330]AAX75063.1 hypothetical protein BruAb1_1745 [Brucella abortus bv. 1 str. 9-941]ABQ61653.1 hypothetical protein BOV_1697 [Brucella ovis ATCC 25840]ADZ87699.1 conserved hypothetical protein [Brucella melitensis M5-90]AEU06746.1 hypothetical protein BSVBI22_A1756 [Brucella suis VBI22]AHN47354.1 hypothetical protein BSS2_I1705 [Brucella suis bv. 1 str. S2]EEH13216.1 Hypothetical protein, conserved [Brucella ceti str. Cudo]EEP63007.1 Hypothetical
MSETVTLFEAAVFPVMTRTPLEQVPAAHSLA